MNEAVKLVLIVLSATFAALFVHYISELGSAHARDALPPIGTDGALYD